MAITRWVIKPSLKYLICAALVIGSVVWLPTLPAAARTGHPGQIDRSFGHQGKVMISFPAESSGDIGIKYQVPFQFTPGHLQMAMAPDGKILISGSTQLVRLLPNGRIDRTFGSDGVVAIERPPGQNFVLADLAVDREGRVLVAGSARPQPQEATPDPLASSAMVRRYKADGSIDSSFGDGGTLITGLGILPPLIGPNRYTSASVGLNSIVVDSQNRPMLSGGSVTEVVSCYGEDTVVSTGFVERLTEAGAPDASFGIGGMRQINEMGSFAQAHLLPDGNLVALGRLKNLKNSCRSTESQPVLTGFDPLGDVAPSFGFSGFRSLKFERTPTLALAPSGKILLLGKRRFKRKGQGPARQVLARLMPNGAADPSFGRIGHVTVLLPRTANFAAIASDDRERIVLAGRLAHRLDRPGPNRSTFFVSRLNPKGSVDRSFGRRGRVATGFGGPSDSYGTQVLVDRRGRVVVGGFVSTPGLVTGGGFAIARYLGSGR